MAITTRSSIKVNPLYDGLFDPGLKYREADRSKASGGFSIKKSDIITSLKEDETYS